MGTAIKGALLLPTVIKIPTPNQYRETQEQLARAIDRELGGSGLGLTISRRLAEAIRRRRQPQPRIIGLSAQSHPEDKDSALDAGMDDYLTKPVLGDELIKAVESRTGDRV